MTEEGVGYLLERLEKLKKMEKSLEHPEDLL